MGITLYDTPKVYKIKDEKLCPIFPATIVVKGDCELQTVYNNQLPKSRDGYLLMTKLCILKNLF